MTIWYDFTTTVRNRGRSGIASVEWHVGQALLDGDPDARCFELRGRRGLVEIDRHAGLAGAVYASGAGAVAPVSIAPPTWRDDLRLALRSRLGRRADPIVRLLSAVYQLPRTVKQRGLRLRREQPRDRAPRLAELVRAGDTVISMGADWDGELASQLLDLKRRTGCSVVTMVYDLVPLTHTHLAFHNDPGLFRRYYRSIIATSDLITCISERSRADLVDFAGSEGLVMPPTAVLLLGETVTAPALEHTTERAGAFLCVGTIERRKNLELIYDALRIIESEGHSVPRVVVAGAPGWGTDDLLHEILQQSTAASRAMVLLGSVDEDTLDRLYRTARALLFPSHFEGWGLPVREAAIRGCPVAAGDSPAIREAAAGFPGATFLSSDDAGPWADYMMNPPSGAEPAPLRPWSAVATDLLAMLPSRL